MKLTKFGILGNKTTSSFTSIRDSKISRECAKILEIPEGSGGKFWGPILENPEGRGVILQIPSVEGGGGVWIFSGTTQSKFYMSLPDKRGSSDRLIEETYEKS